MNTQQQAKHSDYVIEGTLDKKIVDKHNNRNPPTQYKFDGLRLDILSVSADIVNREHAEELIKFLECSKFCLPFKNGTYEK